MRFCWIVWVAMAMLGRSAAWAEAPASQPTTVPATPKVGEVAPDFTLNGLDDKPHALRDFTAKSPVILIVLRGWPGYQCPFCTKQVAEFFAHQKQLRDDGAHVVLIYPGPAENLKAHAKDFLKGKPLPAGFHLLVDPDFTFTNAYALRWNAKGETAYPSTFVIGPDNNVLFAKVSHGHGDRASVDEVRKAMNDNK